MAGHHAFDEFVRALVLLIAGDDLDGDGSPETFICERVKKDHIINLDVSMHDIQGVHVVECPEELFDDTRHKFL